MKSVYETSNTIDANIVLGMLEQAGLSARIEGEYLQGGVGGLQAVGIVRVVVDESDCEDAKAIISSWDAHKTPIRTIKRKNLDYSLLSAIGGFIIGALLVFFLLHHSS